MAKGKKTDLKQDFSVTKMYLNIMVILLILVLILPNFDYFKNIINNIE